MVEDPSTFPVPLCIQQRNREDRQVRTEVKAESRASKAGGLGGHISLQPPNCMLAELLGMKVQKILEKPK